MSRSLLRITDESRQAYTKAKVTLTVIGRLVRDRTLGGDLRIGLRISLVASIVTVVLRAHFGSQRANTYMRYGMDLSSSRQ